MTEKQRAVLIQEYTPKEVDKFAQTMTDEEIRALVGKTIEERADKDFVRQLRKKFRVDIK